MTRERGAAVFGPGAASLTLEALSTMVSITCPDCGTTITDPTADECQFCRRRPPFKNSFPVANDRFAQLTANGQENPFAAPVDDLVLPVLIANPADLRVDGKYLVVRSGVVLPPFCVKTNEPIELDRMCTKALSWSPRLLALLILFHVLIYAIVHFLVRKLCTISFGMSAAYARKRRNRILLKTAILILAILMLIAAVVSEKAEFLIVAVASVVIAAVVLFLNNSTIYVSRYHSGQFWIAGCSPEFLARISTLNSP